MEPIEEIPTEKILHVHFSLVVFPDNSMLSGMQQAETSGHLSYKDERFPTRQPFCHEDAMISQGFEL